MPWSGSSSSVAQMRPISAKMRARSSPGASFSLRTMSDSTISAYLPSALRTSSRALWAISSSGSSCDDLGVDALGALLVLHRRVEDARRPVEQRLLHLERVLGARLDPVGRDVERLGHAGGIRPLFDGRLQRRWPRRSRRARRPAGRRAK